MACMYCGDEGHNSQACPQRDPLAPHPMIPEQVVDLVRTRENMDVQRWRAVKGRWTSRGADGPFLSDRTGGGKLRHGSPQHSA